jgi:integrase
MPVTRNRYQEGSIDRVKRAKGPDVWVYRWRETLPDGRRVQRKRTIGDKNRFKNEADAKRAVEALRAEINAQQEVVGELTLERLWADFVEKELHGKQADRSPTTIKLYQVNANSCLLPRWGRTPLSGITAPAVEEWLGSLSYANPTKAKLRNQLSALFSHAIRHRHYASFNPITGPTKGSGVRQSAKREKTPDILSLEEMQSLIAHLDSEPVRVAVLVAAVTGMRRSEIRGLKFADVDFKGLRLIPKRGKVGKWVTKLKTEASRKPVTITRELAEVLAEWRSRSLHPLDTDWVFASEANGGEEPMWFDTILDRHIRPAAKRAGIKDKVIGWHTFRRSLGSLLAAKGEKVKVVQELLRHANSKITMELYQQSDEASKRQAQEHTIILFPRQAS